MAKLTLDINELLDFHLIGISSHVKDFKFCWALNKNGEFHFSRVDDWKVTKGGAVQSFPQFKFTDESLQEEYVLISNRSKDGYVLPELKQVDFLLLLHGYFEDEKKEGILAQIKSTTNVISAFEIDPKELKSKINLIA